MKIMTKEEKNYIEKLKSMIDERDEYIKDYKIIIYNAFLNMSRLLDRDIVDAVIDSCIDESYFRDDIKEVIDYDQTVNRLKNYEEYEKTIKN